MLKKELQKELMPPESNPLSLDEKTFISHRVIESSAKIDPLPELLLKRRVSKGWKEKIDFLLKPENVLKYFDLFVNLARYPIFLEKIIFPWYKNSENLKLTINPLEILKQLLNFSSQLPTMSWEGFRFLVALSKNNISSDTKQAAAFYILNCFIQMREKAKYSFYEDEKFTQAVKELSLETNPFFIEIINFAKERSEKRKITWKQFSEFSPATRFFCNSENLPSANDDTHNFVPPLDFTSQDWQLCLSKKTKNITFLHNNITGSFERIGFKKVNFINCKLNMKCEGGEWEEVEFRKCKVEIKFKNIHLRKVNFGSSDWFDCRFENVTFEKCKFIDLPFDEWQEKNLNAKTVGLIFKNQLNSVFIHLSKHEQINEILSSMAEHISEECSAVNHETLEYAKECLNVARTHPLFNKNNKWTLFKKNTNLVLLEEALKSVEERAKQSFRQSA